MSGSLDHLAELFERAMALPAGERAAFVRNVASSDAATSARLRALLAADADGESFLDEAPSFAALEHEPELADPTGARADLLGVTLGSFRIRRKLGEGSMAEVFEAEQLAPSRGVAVKVMRWTRQPGNVARRFAAEAETLAQLDHPNVARIHGAGSDEVDGQLLSWLAMELVVDPLPITDYCRRHRLSLIDRVGLMRVVCDAVHHAHRRGFLHRDLKPANVLVSADGSPRVIDFGIARLRDAGAELQRTQVGELVGTVLYMSPEQARGEHERLDVRSDVFSLGVILFELLCGSHPFLLPDEPMLSALAKIRAYDGSSPPDVALPHDLHAIVMRCLQPDPELRYDGAAALRDDLRRYLASEPVAARRPDLWYRLRLFARRRRALCSVLATAALVLVVGTVTIARLYLRAEEAVFEYREAERRVQQQERNLERAQGELAAVRGRLGEVGRVASEEVVASSTARLRATGNIVEQRRVVTEAFEDLERLRATLRDDVGSQVALVSAYQEVGQLIGSEWFSPEDEASVVQAALERACDLARREAALRPSLANRRLLRSVLNSYVDNCRKRNAFAAGNAAADECVAVARGLVAEVPDDERLQADLVTALWARSDLVIEKKGGATSGFADAEAALMLAESLQQDPERWRSLVGWSHFRVGIWLTYRTGRAAEALEHLRQAGDAALVTYRAEPTQRHRQELRTQLAIEVYRCLESDRQRALSRAKVGLSAIESNGIEELPARLSWSRFAVLVCWASEGEARDAMVARIEQLWQEVSREQWLELGLQTADPALEMVRVGIADRPALRRFVDAAIDAAKLRAGDSALARSMLRQLRDATRDR